MLLTDMVNQFITQLERMTAGDSCVCYQYPQLRSSLITRLSLVIAFVDHSILPVD